MVSQVVRARAGHRRMELSDHYPVETVSGIDADAVRGVPLLSHVPHSREAYRAAHEAGIRIIPYVHFMCIHTNYADQDVFYHEHPEIMIKDIDGHWVHTPMDGSDRLHRFLTCANSPSYWKLYLAYVKKMMDWGADGVFVDNCAKRKPCFGPRFNRRNPEFDPYAHRHLFPDATHDYAWNRFLQAVRALVKSYGDDKIVVLNSGIGDPWQTVGDCCMWESFIYSWAWEGRRHTWSDIKARAATQQWYLDAGRRIVANAKLDPERHDMKDDGFYALAAAKLIDFILWSNLGRTEVEFLNRAHMGAALHPYQETGNVAYRFFTNGLVVLNDSMDDRTIELTAADGFAQTTLLDLYEGKKTVRVRNGKVKVSVPRKMARIYIDPDVMKE
jgi:hypothetical protein